MASRASDITPTSLSRTRSSSLRLRFAPSRGQTLAKQRQFPTSETRLPLGRAQQSLRSLFPVPLSKGERKSPTLVYSRRGADPRFLCGSGRVQIGGTFWPPRGGNSQLCAEPLLRSRVLRCNAFTAPPRLRRNHLRCGHWHPLCTRGIGGSERASDLPKTTKRLGSRLRTARRC